MKKLLSIVCVLLLTFSLCVSAFAVSKSGKCGENLFWTLDDDGCLTISGEGQMHQFTPAPWIGAGEIRAVAVSRYDADEVS